MTEKKITKTKEPLMLCVVQHKGLSMNLSYRFPHPQT